MKNLIGFELIILNHEAYGLKRTKIDLEKLDRLSFFEEYDIYFTNEQGEAVANQSGNAKNIMTFLKAAVNPEKISMPNIDFSKFEFDGKLPLDLAGSHMILTEMALLLPYAILKDAALVLLKAYNNLEDVIKALENVNDTES